MSETLSIKILILAANPTNSTRLRLDEEVREIEEGLRRARRRDDFSIEQRWAVRVRDLSRALLDAGPQIVHFSGHGLTEGLILEDSKGEAQLVSSKALSGLFELFKDQVRCVILNACYSAAQAKAISRHVDFVIGMKKEIGDRAAIEFAVGFYDAIGAGRSIEDAYRFGCNAIEMADIPEHLTPILHKKTPKRAAPRQRIAEPEFDHEASSREPSVIKTLGNKKTFDSESQAAPSGQPVELFYSYAHQDENMREELEKSLSGLRRNKLIEEWHDRKIEAGADWARYLDDKLNKARIILLLVSPNFLASDFCYGREMPRAMQRHEAGEAVVIPIILRPCDWQHTSLGTLQALPRGGKPVVKWSSRDEAFLDIVEGIRAVVEQIGRSA
jgi:hypothetical protein